MQSLPTDILFTVFRFLDVKSVCNVRVCCRIPEERFYSFLLRPESQLFDFLGMNDYDVTSLMERLQIQALSSKVAFFRLIRTSFSVILPYNSAVSAPVAIQAIADSTECSYMSAFYIAYRIGNRAVGTQTEGEVFQGTYLKCKIVCTKIESVNDLLQPYIRFHSLGEYDVEEPEGGCVMQ